MVEHDQTPMRFGRFGRCTNTNANGAPGREGASRKDRTEGAVSYALNEAGAARVVSAAPVLYLRTAVPPHRSYRWSALISAGSSNFDAGMGACETDLMVVTICWPITLATMRVGIFTPSKSL